MSAVSYAEALLDRAAASVSLNALISHDPARVLAAAAAADASAEKGPLHGLPLLIKDNLNTTDYPTTAGTPSLAGFLPPRDARIVSLLRDAGAYIFGKANMHELAQGITSSNPTFGPVRNPYQPSLIPGGSSGGNAAGVAARLAPAGVGTDTGGSTRIPAALCGIVGFRPTIGRYPGTGPDPTDDVPIAHSRDTPGPMARSLSDVVLLDAVMSGIADPWAHLESLTDSAVSLRLGVARGYFYAGLDAALQAVVESALSRLSAAGVTLVDLDLPDLGALLEKTSTPVVIYETGRDLPFYLAQNGSALTLQEVRDLAAGPDVRAILDFTLRGDVSEQEYLDALNVFTPQLQAALASAFSSVDALIFPTTILPARPIGAGPPRLDDTVELNGVQVNTAMAYSHNCEVGSNADLPGLSLPCGLTRSGLPVGLELDGPRGSDLRLLALGLAVERILGPLPPPPA